MEATARSATDAARQPLQRFVRQHFAWMLQYILEDSA
jgi:hypothetical protein